MTTLETPKERLKLAVIHAKTSQADIARAIGVTKQQVGRVGQPGYEAGGVAEAVAAAVGVSLEWLVRGTGAAPSWAKTAEVDRTFDEIADLNARKEVGDPMAEVLWEVRKLRAEVAALRAEVAASRPAPAPDAVTASLLESERILSGA